MIMMTMMIMMMVTRIKEMTMIDDGDDLKLLFLISESSSCLVWAGGVV